MSPKFKLTFLLTALLAFAPVAPVMAQFEDARQLAFATLSPQDREFFTASPEETKEGDAPDARTTAVTLFGVTLADNMARATLDEIQTGLAAVLETRAPSDVLDETASWSPISRIPVLYCLLERFDDRMDDRTFARAVEETVAILSQIGKIYRVKPVLESGAESKSANEIETRFAPDVAEKLVDYAREKRPESWEVSLVYADAIWKTLPKTFQPGDAPDDPPRRVSYPIGAPPKGTLYSEARDRVLVLRTLVQNVAKAIDAEGTLPKNADASSISPTRYFETLADATCYASYRGRRADLDGKTDLNETPSFRKDDQTVANADNKTGGVVQIPIRAPFLEDAENDGERYAYATLLLDADRELQTGEYSRARFLAILGAMLQSRLGVRNFLDQAKYLRSSLNARHSREPLETRPPRVVAESARIDALIDEVVALDDDETILYQRPEPRPFSNEFSYDNSEEFQPKRRKLAPSVDFVAMLKRSIELEENYKALATLATERQLRGQYDLAIEDWNRAKTAKQYEVDEDKTRVRRPGASGEQIFSHVDMALAKLNNAQAKVAIDGRNTRVEGMNVTLEVSSQKVRNLKTTFYQLDLAPFIKKARSPEFYRKQDSYFLDMVCDGVNQILEHGRKIDSFAKEVRVSNEQTVGAPCATLTFAMERPGAYLIRVADAENDEVGDYALAFVNRYAFARQSDSVVVSDLLSGKPLANREITLFSAYQGATRTSDSKTETIKTDERGAFPLPKNTGGDFRLLAFVQDEDDDANRSVSVYDSNSLNLAPKFYKFTPRRQFLEKLVLSTNRPIYSPGETVEFFAQIVPTPGQTFKQDESRSVVVSFKGNPRGGTPKKRSPVAKFDVDCDASGAFSGSFQIPKDAELGEYYFTCGKNVKRKELWFIDGDGEGPRDPEELVFVASSHSTVFVSKRLGPDEERRKSEAAARQKALFDDFRKRAERDAAYKPSGPRVGFDLAFDKTSYYLTDEAARLAVSSSEAKDAVVTFYKLKMNGKKGEPQTVELRDGKGEALIPLDPNDAPYFTLVVSAVGGGQAETAFYLVGVQNAPVERGVALDAPATVKSGEKARLRATFAPSEHDDALFAGRATLALYDERLAVVPEDNFNAYVAANRVENKLLARFKLASPPVLSPAGYLPYRDDVTPSKEERSVYADFVAAPARLPRKRVAPVDNPNEDPFKFQPWEFLLGETPNIPAVANDDSFVKETTVSERTDSVSFEFDAPETPGTYRLVFRAFDIEKGASSYAERTLTVE